MWPFYRNSEESTGVLILPRYGVLILLLLGLPCSLWPLRLSNPYFALSTFSLYRHLQRRTVQSEGLSLVFFSFFWGPLNGEGFRGWARGQGLWVQVLQNPFGSGWWSCFSGNFPPNFIDVFVVMLNLNVCESAFWFWVVGIGWDHWWLLQSGKSGAWCVSKVRGCGLVGMEVVEWTHLWEMDASSVAFPITRHESGDEGAEIYGCHMFEKMPSLILTRPMKGSYIPYLYLIEFMDLNTSKKANR